MPHRHATFPSAQSAEKLGLSQTVRKGPDSGKPQETGMNRIIVNWMYPRSLTTVFMRAITNRGDFHTIFEPTLHIYWRDRH